METLNSLRFGETCANIENQLNNNNNDMILKTVLDDIEKNIVSLENIIKVKERWEFKEEVRIDENAEDGFF